MSNGRGTRGMGEYLTKPIERDEHGNAKSVFVVAVERASREVERQTVERERQMTSTEWQHEVPRARRGMGRYLDRSE